jgi:hypothetical protein
MLMLARLGLILSFVFCIHSAAMADERPARPEVGRYIKAFSGDTGVMVWMVRIGPDSDNEVLIQVEGVDHPWDKIIRKHHKEANGARETYTTTVNGSDWQTLLVTDASGELYLPNVGHPLKVTYDRGLAAQGNPQHFLTAYQKQEAEKAAAQQNSAQDKK